LVATTLAIAFIVIKAPPRRLEFHSTPKYGVTSRNAFATLLGAPPVNDTENPEWDKYFTATRILTYQLVHAPETRTKVDIPLIVLVTSQLPLQYRRQLEREGAIVKEVQSVDSGGVETTAKERSKWKDVFVKLRLWELTDYDRILYLDADTILTRPLDNIFTDAAVRTRSVRTLPSSLVDDEAPLPNDYVFAGTRQIKVDHKFPPMAVGRDFARENENYFNAGFFVLKPSLKLFDHYISILASSPRSQPPKFDPYLLEQNLLNYAHQSDRNMAWQMLNATWNTQYSTQGDIEAGVAALHVKWWAPEYKALQSYLDMWRWKMEGFYECRDATS